LSDTLRLIVKNGATLRTETGLPWRGIGCNCYYLAIDNLSHAVADEIIFKSADLGLNVIRLWAFHEGSAPTALQTAPGQFVEERYQMLDYVLDRMATAGQRAILALTDNWGAYGGMQQYVNWHGGGHKDLFYTHPDLRRDFYAAIRFLAHRINSINGRRYGDDPAILAWQLGNEPRCSNASILTHWIAETSAFLKHDLEVRQLVATGMEGFYSSGNARKGGNRGMDREGTDFIAQHALEDIDIAGFHIYPDWWHLKMKQVRQWITEHIRDARQVLGKPAMLDEFGLRVPLATREERDNLFREILEICEQEQAAVSCFWMLYEDGHPDFDQFGVYWPRDASTGAIIREYASRIRNFNEIAG
jgi:mannan endo-1,4-beta-mannosidase